MRQYQLKIIFQSIALVGFVGIILLLINDIAHGTPVESSALMIVLFIGTTSIIDSIISSFSLDAVNKEKPKND